MRAGSVIGGYTLLEDFRVVGAGLSEWTFAVRDGREYFLKRFLSPTYPDDAAPGSPATKARKRARCAEFEAHHRGIQAALQPVTSYGGNLIATLDFFRDGAKYYKVTEKIDLTGLRAADVARLAFPIRLVLLKTVAHSLNVLHGLHIVHSDLKPSNVLIKKTELGYTTKLIDFDSSYIVGTPPPAEEIVGTMNYYSPRIRSLYPGRGQRKRTVDCLGRLRPRTGVRGIPDGLASRFRRYPPQRGHRGDERCCAASSLRWSAAGPGGPRRSDAAPETLRSAFGLAAACDADGTAGRYRNRGHQIAPSGTDGRWWPPTPPRYVERACGWPVRHHLQLRAFLSRPPQHLRRPGQRRPRPPPRDAAPLPAPTPPSAG